MSTFRNYEPKGVIPAALLPFHPDFSIDEKSFRKHLRDVAAVRGLSGLTINAHATEVASCTFEEQERVHAITMDEVGDKIPIRPPHSPTPVPVLTVSGAAGAKAISSQSVAVMPQATRNMRQRRISSDDGSHRSPTDSRLGRRCFDGRKDTFLQRRISGRPHESGNFPLSF